jgi:hypothetical protein
VKKKRRNGRFFPHSPEVIRFPCPHDGLRL